LENKEFIEHFCSIGPKFYSYKTTHNKEMLKTKGITLNWMTRQIFNYRMMRNVLLGHTDDLTHIYSNMTDQHTAVLLEHQVKILNYFSLKLKNIIK
jgi:hypothetical protein